MDVFLVVIFAGILYVGLNLIKNLMENRNLPPGPWGLPIIGYLPFLLGKEVAEEFRKLGGKYGSVFSLRLGNKTVVVLNDFKAVKECLVKQSEIFSGRPKDMLLFTHFNKGRGIVTSEGEEWRTIRRFCLSSLRDLGFGKRSLEEKFKRKWNFCEPNFSPSTKNHSAPFIYL